MTGNRALGVIRISVGAPNQTGEETQKKKIRSRCVSDEMELVDYAIDVDVSADYSPEKRPQLGKWLTERADEFDTLYVLKLDRIIRSNRDLLDLLDWLDANKKGFVSISEGFDFRTQMGRMVAKILSVVAEAELDAIKERIRNSREALRAKGRWGGGMCPFGRIAVSEGENKGYTLKLCPKYGPWLLKMIAEFKRTKSFTATAAYLNANNIPTAADIARERAREENAEHTRLSGDKLKHRGHKWRDTQVQAVLSNPNLIGHSARRDGSIVRDENGDPVMKAAPVLTPEEFEELQALIRTIKFAKSPERPSPFLGVLFCSTCGRALYYGKPRGVRQDRFRCTGQAALKIKPCPQSSFTGDLIRKEVKELFLRKLGDKQVMEKRLSVDDSSAMKIAVLESQLDQFNMELKNGAISATEFAELSSKVAIEREALTKLPDNKPVVEWVPTGQTYAEWWDSTTTAERREKLCLWGVKFYKRVDRLVMQIGDGLLEHVDDERLRVPKTPVPTA